MKTNVVMVRKMGEFDIYQRTKDGFFNATKILKQWQDKTGSQKQLDHYFENKATKELINRYIERKNLHTRNSVYVKSKASRGENAGTWMNPTLFIDFAMWLNVDFKIDVIEMVHDNLIQFRNQSGDSYKKMCDAIYPLIGKDRFQKFITYQAVQIKQACGVTDWETASEEQLTKRDRIHDTVAILADVVPVESVVNKAIQKAV